MGPPADCGMDICSPPHPGLSKSPLVVTVNTEPLVQPFGEFRYGAAEPQAIPHSVVKLSQKPRYFRAIVVFRFSATPSPLLHLSPVHFTAPIILPRGRCSIAKAPRRVSKALSRL